jgi:hypothetical protein
VSDAARHCAKCVEPFLLDDLLLGLLEPGQRFLKLFRPICHDLFQTLILGLQLQM